jgi:hypothetical protein
MTNHYLLVLNAYLIYDKINFPTNIQTLGSTCKLEPATTTNYPNFLTPTNFPNIPKLSPKASYNFRNLLRKFLSLIFGERVFWVVIYFSFYN